jgi:hypothetical protein
MKKRDDQQAVKSAPVEMVVGYSIHTQSSGNEEKPHYFAEPLYNSRATMLLVTPEAKSL